MDKKEVLTKDKTGNGALPGCGNRLGIKGFGGAQPDV